jgi:hypothetical protein
MSPETLCARAAGAAGGDGRAAPPLQLSSTCARRRDNLDSLIEHRRTVERPFEHRPGPVQTVNRLGTRARSHRGAEGALAIL